MNLLELINYLKEMAKNNNPRDYSDSAVNAIICAICRMYSENASFYAENAIHAMRGFLERGEIEWTFDHASANYTRVMGVTD